MKIRSGFAALAGSLALVSSAVHSQSAPRWSKLSVTLPVSTSLFPAGDGAETANSQCLLCHSIEMVLTQPPRSEAQWKQTINKMRTAYGAPLPADQVDTLATYLARLGTDARPGSPSH